jgi:hypothetical protein
MEEVQKLGNPKCKIPWSESSDKEFRKGQKPTARICINGKCIFDSANIS